MFIFTENVVVRTIKSNKLKRNSHINGVIKITTMKEVVPK